MAKIRTSSRAASASACSRDLMATGEMPTAQRTSPQGVGEKILVVEDEDHVRDLVVRLLRRLDYEPLEAKNGPMALAMLREHPDIDLLLTDLFDVVRWLPEAPSDALWRGAQSAVDYTP